MQEVIKAIDRLGAAIIMAAIIGRKDMKITSIDDSVLKKAMEENTYFKKEDSQQ